MAFLEALKEVKRAHGLVCGSEFWPAIIPARDALEKAIALLEMCVADYQKAIAELRGHAPMTESEIIDEARQDCR